MDPTRQKNFIDALKSLPQYEGADDDFISKNISDVFLSGDSARINNFATALIETIPQYEGGTPDFVISNVKDVMGFEPQAPIKPLAQTEWEGAAKDLGMPTPEKPEPETPPPPTIASDLMQPPNVEGPDQIVPALKKAFVETPKQVAGIAEKAPAAFSRGLAGAAVESVGPMLTFPIQTVSALQEIIANPDHPIEAAVAGWKKGEDEFIAKQVTSAFKSVGEGIKGEAKTEAEAVAHETAKEIVDAAWLVTMLPQLPGLIKTGVVGLSKLKKLVVGVKDPTVSEIIGRGRAGEQLTAEDTKALTDVAKRAEIEPMSLSDAGMSPREYLEKWHADPDGKPPIEWEMLSEMDKKAIQEDLPIYKAEKAQAVAPEAAPAAAEAEVSKAETEPPAAEEAKIAEKPVEVAKPEAPAAPVEAPLFKKPEPLSVPGQRELTPELFRPTGRLVEPKEPPKFESNAEMQEWLSKWKWNEKGKHFVNQESGEIYTIPEQQPRPTEEEITKLRIEREVLENELSSMGGPGKRLVDAYGDFDEMAMQGKLDQFGNPIDPIYHGMYNRSVERLSGAYESIKKTNPKATKKAKRLSDIIRLADMFGFSRAADYEAETMGKIGPKIEKAFTKAEDEKLLAEAEKAPKIAEPPKVEERPVEAPEPPAQAPPPAAETPKERPTEMPPEPKTEAPAVEAIMESPEPPIMASKMGGSGVISKKKARPTDKLRENYEKATNMGYKRRTTGSEMRYSDVQSPGEAVALNKIARDVEKAAANRELWDPERLGAVVADFKNANFAKKVDDVEIEDKVKKIIDQLHEDGYTETGTRIKPAVAQQQKLEQMAMESLQAQGRNPAGDFTEEELPRMVAAGRIYTADDIAKEVERIKGGRSAEVPVKGVRKKSELTEEEKMAIKFGEKATADIEQRLDEIANNLRVKQAKAKVRRDKLTQEHGAAVEEVTEETNDMLADIEKKFGIILPRYSRKARTEAAATSEPIHKNPQAVQAVNEKVMGDYFGNNRPKNVTVKISDKMPDGRKWGELDEAHFMPNADGSVTITLRHDLPSARAREVLVHEIPGHFGLARVIKSDPEIYATLKRLFEEDRRYFADNQPDAVLANLKAKYGDEAFHAGRAENAELLRYLDRVEPFVLYNDLKLSEEALLDEWMAKNLEAFDRRNVSKATVSVVNAIRSFFKRLFTRLGVKDVRAKELDDAIRAAVKKMREGVSEEAAAPGPKMGKGLGDLGKIEETVLGKSPPETPPGAPPTDAALQKIEDRIGGRDLVERRAAEGVAGDWDSFTMPSENRVGKFRRLFVDKMQRMVDVQGEIGKGKTIADPFDVILKAERREGVTKEEIQAFKKAYYEPLTKEIHDSGLNIREVGLYLYARHAKEANDYIAKINPKFANGEIIFNGIRQRKPGSGMPDTLADDIMRHFHERGVAPKLERIAAWVDKITNFQQHNLVKRGLIEQSMVDRWNATYKWWVPLKGYQEEALAMRGLSPNEIKDMQAAFYPSGKGKGFSVNYKVKARTGRETLADVDNILSNVLTQTIMDIETAGRNEVAKSFLGLVRTNPNKKLWEIVETAPPQPSIRNGVVVETRRPSFSQEKDILTVFENGKPVNIKIKDEPLQRAMKNMGVEDLKALTRFFGPVTRFFAGMYTRFAPEFGPFNGVRDFQEAMINITSEQSAALASKTAKDILPSMKDMWRYLQGHTDTPGTKMAEEFSKYGGRVEYLDFNTLESVQKRLMKDISSMDDNVKNNLRKYLFGAKDFLDNYNSALENGTRLAYYKTLRESGMSPERAAQKAKNLTVNFNRRGELGAGINAIYVFANAAIQGNRRMLQVLMNTRKGKVAVGAMFTLGYLQAEQARAANQTEYEKLPFFKRARNWMIMKSDGTYYTLPVPYNFGVFTAMGVAANDWVHGFLTPAEAAARVATNLFDAFNPLGEGSVVQTLTPTAGRWMVDLGLNTNFMNAPIKPEGPPWNPDTKGLSVMQEPPQSQRYFKGATSPSIWLAEHLNDLGGGTKYEAGNKYMDISPEAFDYLVKQVAGGPGDVLLKSISIGSKLKSGEEITPREIPFVRRVYGKPVETGNRGAFYSTMRDLQAVKAEHMGLVKENPAAARQYAIDHKNELKAYNTMMVNQNSMSLLKKQMDDAKKSGDSAKAKELQEQIKNTLIGWEEKMNTMGIRIKPR